MLLMGEHRRHLTWEQSQRHSEARTPVIFLRVLLSLSLISGPALGQGLPHGSPAEFGFSPQRLQRIDRIVQEYVDAGRIPGAIALVARSGTIIYQESFGWNQVETRKPMRADVIFRLASMSKPITSVGVMVLLEQGLLLLSDPISRYIPEFKQSRVAVGKPGGGFDVVPARRQITIRDLLSHSGGVSYGDGIAKELFDEADVTGWSLGDRDETVGQFVKRLAALPFDAHPGEAWVYGYGTDILGYVIEIVSGMSLADFLEEHVFEPLRMDDSHFFVPPSKLERFTPVYRSTGSGGISLHEEAQESEYVVAPRRCYSGGAGIQSSIGDYSRFLQMLLNEGEVDGVRILSPASVRVMTANHVGRLYPTEMSSSISSGERGFGLGFWVTEDLGRSGQLGTVGSYGWEGAYYTTFWVDPTEDLFAVFMTHLLPNSKIDLHGKFNALVYQALVEPRMLGDR